MTRTIPVRDPDSLDFDTFVKEFLVPNQPLILTSQWTAGWTARKKWILQNGELDLDLLDKLFGQTEVPVIECSHNYSSAKERNNESKRKWTLSDYLKYLKQGQAEEQLLYLKDFHFQRKYPGSQAYQIPVIFEPDYLNSFCDSRKLDDFRFMYLGPNGSFTPVHHDVLSSYSWSANIAGKKRWRLVSPSDSHKIRDGKGNLPTSLSNIDLSVFPLANDAEILEVIQEPGEILFVPRQVIIFSS